MRKSNNHLSRKKCGTSLLFDNVEKFYIKEKISDDILNGIMEDGQVTFEALM